jgi:hypothetical protein
VYGAAPVGVNVFTFDGLTLLDANRAFDPSLITPRNRFDTHIASLQYTRTSAVNGRFVAFLGMFRGGTTRRKSEAPQASVSSSGAADPYAAVVINLSGLPVMSVEEFRTFTPGPVVSLLLGITMPFGEYDAREAINLGANRWAYSAGLPVVYALDWGPGHQTTLEFTPTIQIFGENRDRNLTQDPLLTAEGNFTHDITPRFWGAVGFLYSYGGATKIHGLEQNGRQKSLGATATLGFEYSPRTALQFSYGETLHQNASGLSGTMYRFKFIYRF